MLNRMKVENIVSKSGNKIANQFVIDMRDNNCIHTVFQSYESTIIDIDCSTYPVTINIYPEYNYSKTTGKYRNIFFEDYANMPELATLKGLENAIKTGKYIKNSFEYKVVLVNN